MKTIQDGFTLIELLLVIVIVGILSGILISVIDINEYNKQARDARRLNDILAVQTAIIDALATSDISLTNTASCSNCNSLTGTIAVDGTGWVRFNNITGNGISDVIQNLPEDPLNDPSYHFSYYSNGSDFELNAVLESKKYQINALKDGGNDNNVYERGFGLTLH